MATEKKEVTLYGVLINKFGAKAEITTCNLKAVEAKKQYKIKSNEYILISRINKTVVEENGAWVNAFGNEFIAPTKQAAIDACIKYYECEIQIYEAHITRFKNLIEEAKKL